MWAQWGWLDPGTCCENGYPGHPLTLRKTSRAGSLSTGDDDFQDSIEDIGSLVLVAVQDGVQQGRVEQTHSANGVLAGTGQDDRQSAVARVMGSQWATSPARLPEALTAPDTTATSNSRRPVASKSQVRGSVSTTFGGVPLVCRGPSTHCTATKGGTRTSTEWPGAAAARVRTVARTAAASSGRAGAGVESSRSHALTAATAARSSVGSTFARPATMPRILGGDWPQRPCSCPVSGDSRRIEREWALRPDECGSVALRMASTLRAG